MYIYIYIYLYIYIFEMDYFILFYFLCYNETKKQRPQNLSGLLI